MFLLSTSFFKQIKLKYLALNIIGFITITLAFSFPLCSIFGSASGIVEKLALEATSTVGKLCSGADTKCVPAILFDGYFSDTSVSRLSEMFEANPMVQWVCFNSLGGNPEAARRLVVTLRSRKIGACVVPRLDLEFRRFQSVCGSSCTKSWLGASQRILADPPGGYLGFHATRVGDGICCTVPNYIKAIQGRFADKNDGVLYGDENARAILSNKGSMCNANQFYRLESNAAVRLELIKSNADDDWYWVPGSSSNPHLQLPIPEVKPCDQ